VDLEYTIFPQCEVTTISGNKMHLFIIPKGNQWGKLMGIDDTTAYLQVGPSKYDKMPDNCVFIRDKICGLDSFDSRLYELMITMDFYIFNGVEGYTVHQTKENFYDDFMERYEKVWERHNNSPVVKANAS